MENLLNENLFDAIKQQFVLANIEEIRLRANCPIVISVAGQNSVLRNTDGSFYVATDYELNYCLAKATQNSLYAVNDQIKQMYISYKSGIRIGITGSVIETDNQVATIKHINSINIRLPHQVKDFANLALNFIYNGNKIQSTLIVSEPGAGKTTLIRDICRGLGAYNTIHNILLVDERCEIACCVKGRPMLNVGLFTDIISGGTKQFAFSAGIRALKPDVIVTDELATEQDLIAVEKAVNSGVAVIASIHAKDQLQLLNNTKIQQMLKQKIFTRIIVLSNSVKGRYQGIYDNNLKCLYMPF